MESQNIKKYNQIEIFGNPRKHLITVGELAEFIAEGGGGDVTVNIDDVVGVTPVGLSVAKATTQAVARTAIGAGTSNLAIGTTATTAKAGNYTPPNVTTTVNGLMLATDKVKLDAVAAQATKNDTDINLKNRANHTGTQPISSITGTVPLSQLPTGVTASSVALGNHTHANATQSAAGFLSAVDKVKLDGLPNVSPVTAPVITITEPTDAAQVQSQFQALINALKTAKVFL